MTKTHYETLGVARDATKEQITNAYRLLARDLNPKAIKKDKTALEELKEINAAYAVLKDPDKKGEYDVELEQTNPDASEAFSSAVKTGDNVNSARKELAEALAQVHKIADKHVKLAFEEQLKGNGDLLAAIIALPNYCFNCSDVMCFGYSLIGVKDSDRNKVCSDVLIEILKKDLSYLSFFVQPAISMQIDGNGTLLDCLLENYPSMFSKRSICFFEDGIERSEGIVDTSDCNAKLSRIKKIVSERPFGGMKFEL